MGHGRNLGWRVALVLDRLFIILLLGMLGKRPLCWGVKDGNQQRCREPCRSGRSPVLCLVSVITAVKVEIVGGNYFMAIRFIDKADFAACDGKESL